MRVERFSHLVDGNDRRCLLDGRKEMGRPGTIEDVKKKIHARARKMLLHGIGNFVWASGSGGGKVGGSRKKFSGGERRAEGRVRLFRARGTAELKEVASGSATQGLWRRNGKVRSQVSGVDRSRFPGRTVLKLWEEEDEEGKPAIERRREHTAFGFDLGEREEQVVSYSSELSEN